MADEELVNGMIAENKRLRSELVALCSEADEVEGYLDTLSSFRFVNRNRTEDIREDYRKKIQNTQELLRQMEEHLLTLGYWL